MSETTHPDPADAGEPARDEVETKPQRKTVTLTEAIVPVAGVAYSIYYLSTIWDLPYEARMSGTLVSVAIFVLTALLAARWTKDALKHGVDSGAWALLGEGSVLWQRLGVLALTVGYVLLLPKIGYFVATLVFLTAAMATLGVRRPQYLILVPLLTTMVGHFAFVIVLGINLPVGFVGELLAPLDRAVGL